MKNQSPPRGQVGSYRLIQLLVSNSVMLNKLNGAFVFRGPQVFQIISQLQKLEFLNLSENNLSQRIDDIAPFMGQHCKESLASIKKLILNNTAMPLETFYSMLTCLAG